MHYDYDGRMVHFDVSFHFHFYIFTFRASANSHDRTSIFGSCQDFIFTIPHATVMLSTRRDRDGRGRGDLPAPLVPEKQGVLSTKYFHLYGLVLALAVQLILALLQRATASFYPEIKAMTSQRTENVNDL